MSPKPRYDLDAQWEDPLDRGTSESERRSYRRIPGDFKLHIATEQGPGEKPLVADGLVTDISLGGVQVKTRHLLVAGHTADLAIPTGSEGKRAGLPKAFLTKARIARVEPYRKDIKRASFSFPPELSNDIEFVLFVERILGLKQVQRQKNLIPDE